MRCGTAKKLLLKYMLDELKKGKTEKLKEHLATCADCAGELETLKETWNLLDVSEEIDVPEHLSQTIEREASSLVDIELTNQGRWFALRWSLVGAGVAFACCILTFLLFKPFIVRETSIQSGMSKQAGEIKIGFYLEEHQRAAQYVSYHAVSRTPTHPRWIPMRREDMFYYDGSERGGAGVFLRSQSGAGSIPEDEKTPPKITESELVSPSEAQELMPFSIIAPEVLGGSYKLELVLKIKDRECVQLIYSNGVHTLSLFEQPVWTKNGIGQKDFQEYILHKAKEGSRNAILGWLTKEIAFSFVGEAGFSELIRLAEEIQEKMAADSLQNFYEEIYGK